MLFRLLQKIPESSPPDSRAAGRGFAGKKAPRKLQSKLFGYYLIVPCVLLAVFTAFFWYLASTVLLRQARQSLTTLNSSFREQVDSALSDLDYVSATINYVNIRKEVPDEALRDGLSPASLPVLSNLYATINSTTLRADQINFYDPVGNTIRIGKVTKYEKLDPDSLFFYEETAERDGRILIGTPCLTGRYATGSGSPDWYLSVYRNFFASRSERNAGVTEAVRRCSQIFRSVLSYQRKDDSSASVYILNTDGVLVYPYNLSSEERVRIEKAAASVSLTASSGTLTRDPLTGRRVRYAQEVSPYSGWTYLTVQQESIILAPFYRVLSSLVFLLILLLAFTLLITWYVSRSMVKPVKHLKHILQRLSIGNLGVEKTDNYNPSYEELGELYAEYQKMSEKLKVSMDELLEARQQELNSRASALQAQVNPHFYYNTLSCISILSENGCNREIEKLCLVLAQCMRYISDTSSSLVSLGTELEYVRKYLYCMKVRYQDSLRCEMDIEPSLLEESIPRLIIQPLAENAIRHGTDCLPPWELRIRGFRTENGWIIEVQDSGNGFSEAAIRTLQEKISELDRRQGLPDLRIGGLGLVSVYLRWKICCGNNAVFEFGNTADGHAFVRLGRLV
ncbi:cache domain-containing sensor histidine kinase [Lachnoclostridium sp. Marseille-P6806]|uniref:cache domain-containing sensor histidine kinase n=1 Tax=Lachnoclostridium sp. Marseille-P6806 TaxID=2364793 RepID=UPI0010306018|nr:histidine kinase [Lachnoclostridium sp. Marseille-P6806]